MQTWKLNRKKQQKAPKQWPRRGAVAVLLLATVGAFFFNFPNYYNTAAQSVGLPTMQEEPFRLGLDLQGGTHLVYEADMREIPESERTAALEGVRDVIERRVNAFGVSEPIVQTTQTGDAHRIIVELAGVSDVEEAINQIGETPVLEFKEPGGEPERALTEEEEAEMEEARKSEREQAQHVIERAEAGENFRDLIDEFSIERSQGETEVGRLEGITDSGPYAPIVEAIEQERPREGEVLSRVVETPQGLSVVRFVEETEQSEFLLSHILICSDEKDQCQNPIPSIEANIQINNLKEEATPENFADLAREHSTGPSAPSGGDLGWNVPDTFVPAFALATQRIDVGEISEPVETNFGFHLIHKRDERTAPAYTVERILLPLTDRTDIVPASPWKNTELSEKHLDRAVVEFDPQSGNPYVALDFNAEGGELFGQLTEEHVGEAIAIFLDGSPISTPVVQQAIYGGRASITGSFTIDEARLLAQRLNAGALPVPVDLLSQQTVGPTLGAISLERSIIAGLFGFLLVALYVLVIYRLPGLIAVMALILFGFLNLAAYRLFGVTITLAGIAGFVLSLGIAVDANVLIIERLKEELTAGRDYVSASREAFSRAWTAIWDGNITTLIAAAILYWFSSSFIRGFALTLSIGVILSMFTAIAVTRIYLMTVVKDLPALRRKKFFGVRER